MESFLSPSGMRAGVLVEYHKAPAAWQANHPNPFSLDGSYGCKWSYFEIVDDLGENFTHGKLDNGLFHLRAGRAVAKLGARLADFLRYEPKHGRSVIVHGPPDIAVDSMVAEAIESNPDGSYLSEEESRWVVHSTDLDAWDNVQRCGTLRSQASLRREGREVVGLGLSLLKEPEDYAQYIMFSSVDAIGPEHVVASRSKGDIFTEENTPYTPGVRLYVDGHRIIRDGLAVWDGVHFLKVRDRVPLEPYLLAAVTTSDLDLERGASEWTPRTFLDAATAHFRARFE